MSKRIAQRVKNQILADLGAGLTQRDAARRAQVSVGLVAALAKASKGRTATKAPSRPVAASTSPEATHPASMSRGDVQEAVSSLVSDLRAALETAKAEGDSAAVAGTARLLGSALGLAEKLAPPPPPVADPNQHPDMVALAERCRSELLRLIDPDLASAPLGPPCPTCGARRMAVSP